MPLLGKKQFNYVKPLTNCLPEQTIFTISHTKEQFRSREDYNKHLSLYKERIWTCQCTGLINISHEEAWNSERAVHKTLTSQFTECYQRPVVRLVHHSVLPLENLVDQTWLKLQQVLSLQEKVSLKVRTDGKVIKATVFKIDSSGVKADPTSNCSSPSSDKENAVEDRNKLESSPKLLPYKYSIQLEGEDKIINSVPESEIVRIDEPPSKELLRLFIRAHAVRVGQASTSPWVVDENLMKKYSLPGKNYDFLLSPVKMAELSERAEKEIPKKRGPVSKTSVTSSNKKLKKSLSVKLPLSSKSPKIVDTSGCDKDNLNNDCVLAEIKQNKIIISSTLDSDSDVPLLKVSKLCWKSSWSRQTTRIKNSAPSEKCIPRKESSLKDRNGKTPVKKGPSKSSSKKIVSSQKLMDKGKISMKDEKKNKGLKKEASKGMKQTTLLHMKKKGPKTPDQAIGKIASSPRIPVMVEELLKLRKTGYKVRSNVQLRKVALHLSAEQRDQLPTDIKNMIQKKITKIEEKSKLKTMTPESKKAYIKQKMAEVKKAKQKEQKEQQMRFEDQTLTTKALPPPKPVPMPEGLPNELFGDVAMVTEFISCFSKLLMPNEEYPIYTDDLMTALVTGKNGFTYLSCILVVLLQTLLQDEISQKYRDLKIPLSNLPVNKFTVSELIRLCLRKMDDAVKNSDYGSDIEDEKLEVAEDVIQLLEGQELYELDVVHKIKIIKGLCLRIMGSYSVQDFMEEKRRYALKLWQQKMAMLKEKNDQLKENEKQEQEHDTKPNETLADRKDPNEEGLTISHFYGKVQEKSGTSTPASVAQDDEVEDLVSVVKRRRIMSAQAAEEKEMRDEEDKIKRENEDEILQKECENKTFEMKFQEGLLLTKTVLRMEPIGTDRNHSRYWIFTSTTPGLYIEKGWIHNDIDYKVEGPGIKDKSNESSSGEMSAAESETTDFEKTKMETVETTVPRVGQNLWFTYDSLKDLDHLIEGLHPLGYRESSLKIVLQKQYSNIVKAINHAQRSNKELQDSDGDKEMLEGFKKELLETELRLRNGGLGGVPDFDLWGKKLQSATDITVMAECLLETQEHVMEKFRKGVMKTKKWVIIVQDGDKDDRNEEEGKKENNSNKESEGKGKVPYPVKSWQESVENAVTLSRLHVLLGMLVSCIKWEKFAENAPESARMKLRGSSYHRASDADSEDEIEHEDKCAGCGGDEELILCAECPLAYHFECHDPPLRHPPRGRWVCNVCKDDVEKKIRSSTRRGDVKRKSQESSTEEEDSSSYEDENEDDSSYEVEVPSTKSARRTVQQTSQHRSNKTKSRPKSRNENVSVPRSSRRAPSDNSDEDEGEDDSSSTEEEEPSAKPARRTVQQTSQLRSNKTKSRPKSRNENVSVPRSSRRAPSDNSDEDEGEDDSSSTEEEEPSAKPARRTVQQTSQLRSNKTKSRPKSRNENVSVPRSSRRAPSDNSDEDEGEDDSSSTEEEEPSAKPARRTVQQTSQLRSNKTKSQPKSRNENVSVPRSSRRAPSDNSDEDEGEDDSSSTEEEEPSAKPARRTVQQTSQLRSNKTKSRPKSRNENVSVPRSSRRAPSDNSDEDEGEDDSSSTEEEEPAAKPARRTVRQTSQLRSNKTKSRAQSKNEIVFVSKSTSRRVPSDNSDESESDGSSSTEEEELSAKSARRTVQKTSQRRSKETISRPQSKNGIVSSPRSSSRRSSDLSICEDILNQLMSNSLSWPFLTAVDKKVVPDYYKIIKRPMDFTSMKNKLTCLNYGLPEEFTEDMALVFRNAVEYNKFGSEEIDCVEKCEKFFVKLLHKKLPSVPSGNSAAFGSRRR